MRITISRQTVKAMLARLKGAYQRGDTRLVRRISALLDVLEVEQPVSAVSAKGGISPGCVYEWVQAVLLHGVASLSYQRKGGRVPKLTPSQKQQLCQWLDDGPQSVGFASGCWCKS